MNATVVGLELGIVVGVHSAAELVGDAPEDASELSLGLFGHGGSLSVFINGFEGILHHCFNHFVKILQG